MKPRFTTILDQCAQRNTLTPAALAEACALWQNSAADCEAGLPEAAHCLLDPLLLAGLCVANIQRTGAEAVLNMALSRSASGGEPDELWAGPVRLLFSGVSAIDCSKGSPASIKPTDPVVWCELRATAESATGVAILLRFRSNQRLRIEAQSVRFASMNLPC